MGSGIDSSLKTKPFPPTCLDQRLIGHSPFVSCDLDVFKQTLGRRNEIDVDDGFKLGKLIRLAWDQSRYTVES